MASQVPSSPLGGGDDYFTLLRKARQRRTAGARSTMMDLAGLSETQRRAVMQAQSLTDRFEMELDVRQKALDDARKARQQQATTDRRKTEQAEAARKLEKARKEMERLKTQAQSAAASGDVERARAIAQAVKGVLRDISAALRTLHSASVTAFLSGEAAPAVPGGGAEGQAEGSVQTAVVDAGTQAGTPSDEDAAGAQDLNGDGAVDAADRTTAQRQADPAGQQDGRTVIGGKGIDPVLIEAQGEAAKAVAIARQIVSILRTLRPRPEDRDPAGTKKADGQPETPAEDVPGRGYRGAVEQMSADVEGLALGLVITSGQTLNIQA